MTRLTGPRQSLLQFATALADPATRLAAADALAREFGGRRLLMFMRDAEVNMLLPAPGFPAALHHGDKWAAFLADAVAHGTLSVNIAAEPPGTVEPIVGVGYGPDIVFVVIGTSTITTDVEWFRALLPMFATIFRAERTAAAALLNERMAKQAAARAAQLNLAVDGIRRQLEDALDESRRVRRDLEQANTTLQAQAEELRDANQRLRDQADELEVQAAELELQTEEMHRTVEELAAAREAADKANRAKSEFLATMSHELRTPLNAIAGHTQLIELGVYGTVNDQQREALGRIDRSQRHLLGLINNVLNLSRIEAGRVDYDIRDVSVHEALTDLRPMIEPQFRARNIAYEVRDNGDRPWVRADCEKLQQILLNLLSNAVKFTEPGGKVMVEWRVPGDDREVLYIRVVDSGQGIPMDKLDAIFDPFTQVDSSHSRVSQGTGLGLTISRDLARGMGGDLRARSEPGEGSSFTLCLPLASVTIAEHTKATAETVAPVEQLAAPRAQSTNP